MAIINAAVDKTIADGYKLKFRTPCDSTIIEGLEVKYPAKDGIGTLIKKFVFKDAHGTELSGVGNLFVGGVLIEVLLDVTHSVAYIQNADTNSYVESVKSEVQRLEEKQKEFLGVAGKAVEECERVTAETVGAIEATNNATNTLVLTHDEFVSGGYVEALKELHDGKKFSFWVGTTDEYNAIPEKVNNCFYILTDDASRNEILVQIDELQSELALANGSISDLITELETTKGDVTTLQGELETTNGNVADLQNDKVEIQSRVYTLESEMETANTDIAGVQTRLANVSGQFFVSLFDGEIVSSDFEKGYINIEGIANYNMVAFLVGFRDSSTNTVTKFWTTPVFKEYYSSSDMSRFRTVIPCSRGGITFFEAVFHGEGMSGMFYDATHTLGDTVIVYQVIGVM
jgi:hypothetical protein